MERLTKLKGNYIRWNGNQDYSTRDRYAKVLNHLAAYEDTGLTPEQIEAQQQGINLLIMGINELRESNQALKDYAENADTDKDEQAGRIMRMDTCLKKAKQMFKNIEIINSWPETGSERNALVIAADGHRLIDALLGGKEE